MSVGKVSLWESSVWVVSADRVNPQEGREGEMAFRGCFQPTFSGRGSWTSNSWEQVTPPQTCAIRNWRWDPASCVLTRIPGTSAASWSWRPPNDRVRPVEGSESEKAREGVAYWDGSRARGLWGAPAAQGQCGGRSRGEHRGCGRGRRPVHACWASSATSCWITSGHCESETMGVDWWPLTWEGGFFVWGLSSWRAGCLGEMEYVGYGGSAENLSERNWEEVGGLGGETWMLEEACTEMVLWTGERHVKDKILRWKNNNKAVAKVPVKLLFICSVAIIMEMKVICDLPGFSKAFMQHLIKSLLRGVCAYVC